MFCIALRLRLRWQKFDLFIFHFSASIRIHLVFDLAKVSEHILQKKIICFTDHTIKETFLATIIECKT